MTAKTQTKSEISTGSYTHVSGRLVNQEPTSSPVCASKRILTKPASQLCSKLAKSFIDTNSENKLFEGSYQFDKRLSFSGFSVL